MPRPASTPTSRRPLTRALSLSGVALGVVGLGPFLAWVQRVPSPAGMMIFVIGGLLGLPAAAWGLYEHRLGIRSGGSLAAALGMIAAGILALIAVPMLVSPAITDVTTAPDDPPTLKGGTAYSGPADGPAPLRIQREAPWVYADVVVFTRRQPGWRVESLDPETWTLRGTAQSAVLRFDSAYAIRVRPDGPDRSRIDVRLRAEEPGWDPGREPTRLRAYLDDLEAALQASPEG